MLATHKICVGAIIQAAGLSGRLLNRNRLWLPIAGAPMFPLVVETYLAAFSGDFCVATGFEATRVETVHAVLPIRLV